MKGQRFCNAIDIIRNPSEELKRLLQNGYRECFQHCYNAGGSVYFAQGDCFERNVA